MQINPLEMLATELSTRHHLPALGRRVREVAFEQSLIIDRLRDELAKARRTISEIERDAREDMDRELGAGQS